MNSIALFYWPNLSEDQRSILLSLSQVGTAVPVDSGEVIKYSRLRNIDLEAMQSMNLTEWTFPAHIEDENLPSYNARVKAETITAFNNLKNSTHDVIWLSESGFHNLSRQPEFIES